MTEATARTAADILQLYAVILEAFAKGAIVNLSELEIAIRVASYAVQQSKKVK